MENITIESIQEKAQEMKRSGKTLRHNVRVVLDEIAEKVLAENDDQAKPEITVKGRYFSLRRIAFGFGPGHNANSSTPEFCELDARGYCMPHITGFEENFRCWNGLDANFSAGDILFLARNLREIVQAFDTLLDGRLKNIEEAAKYLA